MPMRMFLEELTICVGDGCESLADEAGWEGHCSECLHCGPTTPPANMIRRWTQPLSTTPIASEGEVRPMITTGEAPA